MDIVVIALGGNAIMKRGELPIFSIQYENVKNAAKSIGNLISKNDIRLVITHGNGPQVGNELLRNEYASNNVPQLPLYILTAETQAFIGSMLESAMINELQRRKIKRRVSAVLTHVVVDSADAAFRKPSKPIGPFYSKDQLEKKLGEGKFDYVEQKGAYRRVVASPTPIEVIELDSIKGLLDGGDIVIAGGGGGIPVSKSGRLIEGMDAVIDKDLTTQVLANELKADRMVILTDAEYVYRDQEQEDSMIKEIGTDELTGLIGSFQSGTIRPKVEACIRFVKNGGKEAYIGNLFKLTDILKGESGTRIIQ